jgi:hypothetical protein
MEMKRILEFKEIFNEEPSKDVSDYLVGINKSCLVKIAAMFLTGLYEDSVEFCCDHNFFSSPNDDFAEELCRYVKSRPEQITIINNHASLHFLEEVLSLPDCKSAIIPDPAIEVNILKAYLVINQKLVAKETPLISRLEQVSTTNNKLASYLFYPSLAYFDFTNYDYGYELIAQIIKAIYFFKFIEKEYPNLMTAFCKKYGFARWEDYLQAYSEIPLRQNTTKETAAIALQKGDDDFDRRRSFLDKFTINSRDVKKPDPDFTQIRHYPFYKESNDRYLVLYKLFAAERIYRRLYFDFEQINENVVDKEHYIKGFRSKIPDKYSERYILYKILDETFNIEGCIKHSGSEFKASDKGIQGEPDYYVRMGNDIFLIESKDIRLNDEIKTSYDYDKIYCSLRTKLSNGKGVDQLCKNIKGILHKGLPLDCDYEEEQISIYPILVLHDRVYSNPGLNSIVNGWYEEAVQTVKKEIVNPDRIKSVIIIDLDTLILLRDLDISKDLNFKGLLDEYLRRASPLTRAKTPEEMLLNRYSSFKDFAMPIIEEKIRNLPPDHVAYLLKISSDIFPESSSSSTPHNIWS